MKIDFAKNNGLVPAIVQDTTSNKVLMLAYMSQESYDKTLETGKVTFFSRSRNELWTKGETSGNFLMLDEILVDCDADTLLVKATPVGPACHTGNDTCFNETNDTVGNFILELESVIADRKANPKEGSYTNHLFNKGINKIAQKVGEEATETVIDAVTGNIERTQEESADLLYHMLVMFQHLDISWNEVMAVLKNRHS